MLLAAADPSIVAAVLTAAGAVAAGVFSLRSKVSADLVDDVMADRAFLREEVGRLRQEVDALKLGAKETERALLACQQSEVGLRSEIARLEAALG